MLWTDTGPIVTRKMMMSVRYRNSPMILCQQSHLESYQVDELGQEATVERDKEETRVQERETEKMPYPTLHVTREATDPPQGEAPRRQRQRNMDWTTLAPRGHPTLCGHLRSH